MSDSRGDEHGRGEKLVIESTVARLAEDERKTCLARTNVSRFFLLVMKDAIQGALVQRPAVAIPEGHSEPADTLYHSS